MKVFRQRRKRRGKQEVELGRQTRGLEVSIMRSRCPLRQLAGRGRGAWRSHTLITVESLPRGPAQGEGRMRRDGYGIGNGAWGPSKAVWGVTVTTNR